MLQVIFLAVMLLQVGKASLVEELRSLSVVKSRLELQLAAAVAGRTKDARDIARLRDERNGAVSEYNQVMSERDNVLHETEQLRSRISTLEMKVEVAEKGRKAAVEEAERARVEFEASRLQAEALASSLSLDSSYLKEVDRLQRDLDKMQSELLGSETFHTFMFCITFLLSIFTGHCLLYLLSVCLHVTLLDCVKTAAEIELFFQEKDALSISYNLTLLN